jgi:hypothetical protein
MWNTRGVDFIMRVNIWGLCEEKSYLILTFISGINNVFKKYWTEKEENCGGKPG